MERKWKTAIVAIIALWITTAFVLGTALTQANNQIKVQEEKIQKLEATTESGGFFSNPIDIVVGHPSCDDIVYDENLGYVKASDVPGNKCDQPSEKQTTYNVVTFEGMNWTRDVLSGLYRPAAGLDANSTVYGNWTVLEWSTSSTTVESATYVCPTVVTGSGLDIKQATVIYKSAPYNVTMNATWTASGTVTGIAKLCLTNNTATASSDLMALALLATTVNVVSGDTLTGSYTIGVRNSKG